MKTLLTLMLLLSVSLLGASFDCAKAATKVEKMICANPELSALDENLSKTFKEALKATDDKEQLKKEQFAWMKERNKCQDVECLKIEYENRLTTFLSFDLTKKLLQAQSDAKILYSKEHNADKAIDILENAHIIYIYEEPFEWINGNEVYVKNMVFNSYFPRDLKRDEYIDLMHSYGYYLSKSSTRYVESIPVLKKAYALSHYKNDVVLNSLRDVYQKLNIHFDKQENKIKNNNYASTVIHLQKYIKEYKLNLNCDSQMCLELAKALKSGKVTYEYPKYETDDLKKMDEKLAQQCPNLKNDFGYGPHFYFEDIKLTERYDVAYLNSLSPPEFNKFIPFRFYGESNFKLFDKCLLYQYGLQIGLPNKYNQYATIIQNDPNYDSRQGTIYRAGITSSDFIDSVLFYYNNKRYLLNATLDKKQQLNIEFFELNVSSKPTKGK